MYRFICNFKKYILFAVIVLTTYNYGQSQNISNKGKDFWVAYGHHQFMETNAGYTNNMDMVLYLSADQPAVVKVTLDSSGNGSNPVWTRTYNIPANTVISTGTSAPVSGVPLPLTPAPFPKNGVYDFRLYSINCSFVPPGQECGSEQIFTKKGIHIESDVPIVAYSHIYGSVSSGATMLLPVESWGHTYTSINSNQTNADNSFSWMYVIANKDSTLVEITPSVITRKGKPAGVPFTVLLHKGHIYQLVGQTTGINGLELTGTKVKSIANSSGNCYAIAVFSGSSRTGGICAGSSGGRDNDMQQLFSQNTWGKKYLTAPTSNSSNAATPMTNVYKVAVKDPTTIVKRNGTILSGLILNSYYRFESNTADLIEADKSIMVAQFMTGGTCLGGGNGDPEMIYLSPIEQSIKSVGFYRNTREAIIQNYVTAILPTNGLSSLKIDGVLFGNIAASDKHSYPHSNYTGFSVAIRRWGTSAQSQVLMVCDSAFTAITYGLGGAESYGYNAGTFLNNLNMVGSIRNPADTSAVKQHDYTCKNSPVTLSALYLYQPQKLVWELSTLGANITPNTDVTDNSPVANDSVYINGIKYYKYSLPGTYQFNDTGTFVIPINSTHPSIENCLFSEKLTYTITVKPTPKPTFTYTHSGCTTDTVFFFGNASTLNGYQNQQYLWTFPGPTTATAQNTSKLFPPGAQTVNFRVVTNVGCVGDTTATINIQNRPGADFTFAPLQICENGQVTFTDNSGVSGTGPGYNWYWDFGNSTIVNATSNVNQTQTYPVYGTYTVKHVVRSSATCFSDTVSKIITVYAKPRVNFTFPTNCVGTNGQVLFTNTTTIPDGQTLGPWAWTFNDPNANGGNPNTSTALSPTHNFSDGTYNVNLQAISQQGCIKDTTIAVLVKVSPALSFPSLAGICINTAAISIANATVTNGVTGSGVYYGPGTSTTGTFTPTSAGVGTHTIWYKFTSTNGCVDSVSQTILVKAKPIVSYTYPTGGCLPPNGLAQFNGTANLSDGQTVSSWAWNFNDPNANGANPNVSPLQSPTHNFTANGIYNVNLTVISNGSCSGDTTIPLNFNIKPSLAYPAINSVCINAGGTVNVATASVTNGASGTGVYNGPGTTAAGIFTPTAAGVGTHTIWYKFTTPNGCVDSIAQTILVKAKPIVNFTYPTGGCLPPNGLAQFNGTANLSDGQTVSSWAWNFNDPNANGANPNVSPLQSPTHNFTANGIYNVNLTVISNGSCSGDTTIPLNFNIKPSLAYPAINSVCINAGGTVNVATASVTNGASGTGVYSGPGTTVAGIFTPTAAGVGTHTIWYKFTTPNGCVDSIAQTILVKAKPIVNFTYPTGGCLPPNGLAQFNGTANLSDGQTVSSWSWNFNDPNANGANPNGSPLQSPTHNFTANGIYNVNLTVISSGSCSGDTTIPLNFNIKPSLAYPAINSVCINAGGTVNVATASVTNGASGTGVYSGPGTTVAGIFTPTAAGVGTHTIWYKFTTPNGCVDSIAQTILVKAKPIVNFTYPTGGCLPPTGLAQFNGTANLSDGQTVSSWAWNFNDPNANGANPNTSPSQSPTHNFTVNGIYNVNLTVNSNGNCTGDTTIALNFNVKPSLAYPALSPVCQSVTGTITVATASVTNGATGTGIYTGPSTNPAGQFSPSGAGAGVHTIWYKFTTPNGCVDSIAQTITVQPKPTASFTKTDACAGLTSTFTSTATIAAGNITNWYWDFGDATTANYNNGNPFTKTYANAGTYTVKLVATSSAGCVSDTAFQTVIIHPNPVAAFSLPASVCMPGNAVNMTNQSTIAGNGTLAYSWTFGDGNTSSQTNPAHIYAAVGNYNIVLTTTSAFGCVATTNKPFNAFFVKPVALFSVNKDTLCQGENSIFTDLSTDPVGSPINIWNWSFGDGSVASVKNPTKTFSNPNNYTVNLTVTNAAGCVSSVFTKPVLVNLQPVIDAGPSFTVMQGTVVTFSATANSTNGINLNWSPNIGLSSNNVLQPKHTATADRVFTLTATGPSGCTASDFLNVKVLKPVKIPNAFSPNGDGTNDRWDIENLIDYTDCNIQIYNRYGQKVQQLTGYAKPWDGTINGKPLPVATYYYIIDLKNGFELLKGSVTIIR